MCVAFLPVMASVGDVMVCLCVYGHVTGCPRGMAVYVVGVCSWVLL